MDKWKDDCDPKSVDSLGAPPGCMSPGGGEMELDEVNSRNLLKFGKYF